MWKESENEMQSTPELYKIIIVLAGLLFGSWGVFIWIVKRWVQAKDANIKELYESRNKHDISITEIRSTLEMIYKNLERIKDVELIAREYAIRFDNMKEQHDKNHGGKK